MTGSRRAALQAAFLLHHRDWSDSSRVVELITRDHGRVSLFARGVRRPKSALRAVLQPFMPLLVSWTGGTDGGQLTGAELAGEATALPAARLMSGFYMNELLLKLTLRGDTIVEVFDAYALAIDGLRTGPEQAALRRFEKQLLEHLGYGIDVSGEAGSGEPLAADRYYHFRPGFGAQAAAGEEDGAAGAYLGADLLGLAEERFDSPEVLRAAKRVLREALEHCLEGRGLRSRDVMLALRRQENDR